MRSLSLLGVVTMVSLLVSSCAGDGSSLNRDATRNIDTLEAELQQSASAEPSIEQYQASRGKFLERMQNVQLEQGRMAGSSIGKIKNIFAMVGVTVALGGTVASLAVDDDDDKATIAQTSAAIAGISGLAGVLPVGAIPKGAASIEKYLEIQIPAFEERWPSNLDEPLKPEEWRQFRLDEQRIERVLKALSE